MNAVVASVRLGGEAILLPGSVEGAAEGVSRGVSRIGRTQDLATEIGPGEELRVELNDVVVDGDVGSDELLAHLHEEGVEGEDGRSALKDDLTAVESTAELDLLGRGPELVKAIAINAKLLGGIKGIEHTAGSKGLSPRKTEASLELVSRDGNGLRLQDGGLGSNGVVVLIDQLALIDLGTGEVTLLKDGDALSTQGVGNKLLGLGVVGMGLDEDESRVLGSRHFF